MFAPPKQYRWTSASFSFLSHFLEAKLIFSPFFCYSLHFALQFTTLRALSCVIALLRRPSSRLLLLASLARPTFGGRRSLVRAIAVHFQRIRGASKASESLSSISFACIAPTLRPTTATSNGGHLAN